ncbi:MAG TPA: VOC family protein [Methylomirabilota bacterium]|nr:VOC family protein [Methylomirabilota bacterium]
MPQKITPFLWYTNQAEEAVNFYTSVFKNAKIKSLTRYSGAGPGPQGSVMTASFEIEGQEFVALNGGPVYQFTPAVSFVINCDTQEEVDHFWEKLSAGGRADRCGWLTDKFGLSWQVVPKALIELLSDPDPAKSKRVMEAMLQMTKIDIPTLKKAAGA